MIDLNSIDYVKKQFSIQIPITYLKVIISAIELVNREVTYGFHARLGYFPEETLSFKEKIFREVDVCEKVNQKSSKLDTVKEICFEYDEFAMINQFLNEICNGLKVDDFERKIGISKNLARSLLAEVNLIIRQFQDKMEEDTKGFA